MSDIDKALVEAMKDAVLYGTGFMKDGKHISIEDVYLDPRDAIIEAQAAEIERLTKASDGDVGLMHWQGEKIERLEAEIDRLRNVVDSLIDRIAGMAALTPPATIILDPATLAGKAEQ